jgi:hypothetical protein
MPNLVFKDDPNSWHTGTDFPNVALTRVSWDSTPTTTVAYVFFGHVNVDFDGSPTAYGPPGMNPPPDDDLGNAGNAAQGWFGVYALPETDPLVKNHTVQIDRNAPKYLGKYPVIQQAKNGDPKPGYYVSTTPRSFGPADLQDSYIDSSEVSFGALDGAFQALGVSMGDYGLAIRHNKNLQSGFYFADAGGYKYALGECSHKVGKNLGGSGRASHFNNNFPVSFMVFPRSFDMDPDAVASVSDGEIAARLKPLVRSLSCANNFDDLVLLMGFNETPPKTKPHGRSKLEAYKKAPSNPRPANYDTVVQGLRAFGWSPLSPAPTYKMSLPG